jgi:ketosteroid isomerase-like protein
MSQENVKIARSIYAAWGRGDFSRVGWAHPEIEYVIVEGPAPGSWRGLAGLEEGGLGILSAWKGLRVEAEDCRMLDDERVLVLTRLSGRGKTSGIELGEMRASGADILEIRGGKVVRFLLYWNREHTLADLGLSEQDARADS